MMEVRKPKALLLPFCDPGYDLSAATKQVEQLAAYLNRLGIQCVVADLISNYAQAAKVADVVAPYSCDFPILYPVTWSEPRLAVTAARPFFGKPMAVWCTNWFGYHGERIEMSSAPAAAALRGCLQEMGIPCEFFADLPEEGRGVERLRSFAAAARAISNLRRTKIGFFGMYFNGITAADFDLSLLRKKFGTEIYSFDVYEMLKKMEQIAPDCAEYAAMKQRVCEKVHGAVGAYLDRIVRMCVVLEQYVREYDLQALDLRCNMELSQTYGLSACLPLSVLGDSVICSCEADVPVVLTQVILQQLTGCNATYVDLRTFTDEGMEVGACGFAPAGMTGGCADTGLTGEPESGYLTNANAFDKGAVTLARMLKYPGGELALHMAKGTAEQAERPLREMGCPRYPMAKVRLDSSMEDFMSHVGANHYALTYGSADGVAAMFCKYTGISLL